MPSIPAFEAAYCGLITPPICAATELRLMIRPRPRLRMSGSRACVTRKHDLRSPLMISSQSASVISSSFCGRAMPALFTRMSIGPSAARTSPARPLHVGSDRDIRRDRDRPAAQRADPFAHRVRIRGARPVVHRDIGARFSERDCDGSSDAAAGAGHESDASGEFRRINFQFPTPNAQSSCCRATIIRASRSQYSGCRNGRLQLWKLGVGSWELSRAPYRPSGSAKATSP